MTIQLRKLTWTDRKGKNATVKTCLCDKGGLWAGIFPLIQRTAQL
jgi:hypothetical protein